MSDTLLSDEKPKRSPRKRAASPRARKTTVRKLKTVKSDQPVVVSSPSSVSEPARKAPTPLREERQQHSKKRTSFIVAVFLLLLGVAGSMAVGFTDEGQIDINRTIEERNERIRNNKLDDRDLGTPTDLIVPVQNTNVRPDGGLIPLTPEEIAASMPAPAESASTSATSSTASSSSAVSAVASTTIASTTNNNPTPPETTADDTASTSPSDSDSAL